MPLYNRAAFVADPPLEVTRTILHVTNGAAGAPYYALERTPWNADYERDSGPGRYLKRFTTQNALVFFHVHGPQVRLEVVNPDSLERIE